jgi:hypothetical protein
MPGDFVLWFWLCVCVLASSHQCFGSCIKDSSIRSQTPARGFLQASTVVSRARSILIFDLRQPVLILVPA